MNISNIHKVDYGKIPLLIKKTMVTQSQNYSCIEQDPLLFNSATFQATLLGKVKSDSNALAMASGGGRLFLRKHFP